MKKFVALALMLALGVGFVGCGSPAPPAKPPAKPAEGEKKPEGEGEKKPEGEAKPAEGEKKPE